MGINAERFVEIMLEVLVEVIVVCLIAAICNCEEGDVEQPAYYTVQGEYI